MQNITPPSSQTIINKPSKQISWDQNLCIIGWNCRSLSGTKIQAIDFMLQKYKPDWILVWETWLNKDLYITQPEYEWIQAKAARHQGAWIIIKRNCTKRYIETMNHI